MVCYCPERKILYIHIPKCAGLTIEGILLNKYGFKHFTFPNTNDPYPFLRCPKGKLGIFRYILKYSNESKIYNLKSFKKFTFVRNPYTKGESAIRYLHECAITEPVKQHFPLGIDRFYLTCLNREYYYNHYCLSQITCIEDDEGNNDFRIGRFENLMDDLKNILFNEYELEPFNIDGLHANKSNKAILELKLENVYRNIAKIQKRDFELLGYDITKFPISKISDLDIDPPSIDV
jgi:hypothetical protein